MTNWTERARTEISQTEQVDTDKTDKRGVSSVSSVGVWAVLEKNSLAADLIEAAMRVCDGYGDNDKAREEMRRDCLELPPDQQADLLDYFRGKR